MIPQDIAQQVLADVASGKIKVGTPEEIENADFRLCSLNRNMPDLLTGQCGDCGVTIYFCKGGPDKPKKICIKCALGMVRGDHCD